MLPALAALAPVLLGACAPDDSGQPASVPDLVPVTVLGTPLDGLLGPTDVAVAGDGSVFVIDGAAGRLHRIPADGTRPEAFEIPGKPVGLGWGGGRLWTTRTDAPVLLEVDPSSGRHREWPVEGAGPGARLTDVAVVGQRIAVVDVRGAILTRPLAGGAWTAPLQDLGQAAPFLATAAGGNWLAISDVRTYSVLLADVSSAAQARVGHWGAWEGAFLHPSGVAVDERGRCFAADSLEGVVQVFDADGRFVGALGLDGALLRFEQPMGLALSGDTLYVVDQSRGALLSLEVGDIGRTRSRWLYERKVPRFSYLADTDALDGPAAARMEAACRSCHDGSFCSTALVWTIGRFNHPVNKVPKKPVPERFDLDARGQVYCGTCHIPHRIGDDAADPEVTEVFLREPRARSLLCAACHEGAVMDPATGERRGHRVGELPSERGWTGAREMAAGVERVECLDCHATHGAVSTSLVRAEVGTGEACAVCHAGVSPERNARSHPVDRRLADPAVVARLRAKGAFLAGAGSVTCLTCHDVHESVGREGLTRHLEDAERCLVCHRERGALAGGAHDLEAGRDGPVDSACRACHAVHAASGPALSVTAGRKGDPTDCLGCHGGRGMARAAVSPGRGHPLFEENDGTAKIPSVGDSGCLPLGTRGSSGCLTCHDPHAAPSHGGGAMLRMPSADADTCVACHPEKASTRGTDHDLREHASPLAQKRGRSMARGGFCLACHGFHERDGWRLLDLPPSGGAGENPAERACLACHRSEGTAKATVVRVWEHPGDLLLTTASLPWRNTGELPLFDARGERTADTQIGRIACLTCHDPHVWSPKQGGQGGAGDGDIRTSFLREGWEPFCSGCHGEDALNAYRSYHDPAYREKARARARRGQWPIYGEEQP